ncbi:hypothetical protein [Kamptonema sp. PCC 6506]|nr:hypothetical protein [Kamptonema sp. PCC 6506]
MDFNTYARFAPNCQGEGNMAICAIASGRAALLGNKKCQIYYIF